MAFLADGGGQAVAGMDHGFVREGEQFGDERFHDFFHGAAPQIGASDAAREKRIAGKKKWIGDGNFPCVG